MTITYQPPLTGSPFHGSLHEPINEGPGYGRTRNMGRWHRIRSGQRWIPHWAPDELREFWNAWCGYTILSVRKPIFTDVPFPDEPVCGTCEGRALGADPSRPDLIFLPRTLQPPKNCPGTHSMLVREDQGVYNRATCLVCEQVVKMRALGGSPYSSSWGSATHPATNLPDPCPFHGWKNICRSGDGVLVCSYCDHIFTR